MPKSLLFVIIPSAVLALCLYAFIRSVRVTKDEKPRVHADEVALVETLAASASETAGTANNPMLDPATGTIHIDGSDLVIGPGLTREAFLQSDLASAARVYVDNEPWRSWSIKDRQIAGRDIIVTLFFHGEKLAQIGLMASAERFGTSWEDHTEAKELCRKSRHEALLREVFFGIPAPDSTERPASKNPVSHRAPWGTVSSFYDSRGGFSSIRVKYGEPEQ